MRKISGAIFINDLQASDIRLVLGALKAFAVQPLVIIADCKREVRSILADLQQIQQDLAIVDIVNLEDADFKPRK